MAFLLERAADESKGREMDEIRTWTDRGWATVKRRMEAGAPGRRSVVPY